MSLLEAHKQRLEREIVDAKTKIWQMQNSDFPDLMTINQLKEAVERNWQLIEMIDMHSTEDAPLPKQQYRR